MKKSWKNILIFSILIVILLIIFLIEKSMVSYVAVLLITFTYIYLSFRMYYRDKSEKKYIEEKLEVAKINVFNVENVIILIIKDNKIVWGNDIAYEEFPHLHEDRSWTFLAENEDDEILKYNNKIYQILQKGEIYFLINITGQYRESTKLRGIQTVIGLLQVDNLTSLKQVMEADKYHDFISDFKKDLIKIFIDNNIFFQEMDDDKYYLNIPYAFIEEGIANRFKEIGELIKKYHEKNILVTTSMGIAYNYPAVLETGKRAQEAFDLAVSRGGAQIVIFDEDKKYYFGGGISETHDSIKLRARIIGNTLTRLVEQREVIYIMSHANPDSDAIAAQLLLYNFLKKENNEVRIIVDKDSDIEKYQLDKLDFSENIITSYVIDQTKKNVLIVVDTQSKDIVARPSLVEDIEDVVILDHHQTPNNYFRGNLFSWIEPNASSTVELIMAILTMSGFKVNNEHINNLGILGILTDTNRLKYRVSNQTFDSLMNLVDWGGKYRQSLESLYLDTNKFLEKQLLLSKINFINKFSVLVVKEEYDDILLSIVVDEMLEVKNISGSIIFALVDKNRYRVKIRTNGEINAKVLIEKYEGGGHATQAAGFVSEEEMSELLRDIKDTREE